MGEDVIVDASTTVNRMESDLLNLLREKFQQYSEHIFHLLNVELVIKGDSDIVDFTIPGTVIKVSFNPNNEGYGLKLFNGQDFVFVSPSEMSITEGSSMPLEEGMLELSETQIRSILELLKTSSDGLQSYVNKCKEELQEKINMVSKY